MVTTRLRGLRVLDDWDCGRENRYQCYQQRKNSRTEPDPRSPPLVVLAVNTFLGRDVDRFRTDFAALCAWGQLSNVCFRHFTLKPSWLVRRRYRCRIYLYSDWLAQAPCAQR